MRPDRPVIDALIGADGRVPAPAQPERTRRVVLIGLLLLNVLVVAVCAGLLLQSRRTDIANAKSETLHDVRLAEQLAAGLLDKAAIALGAVGGQVERQLGGAGLEASTLWSIVDAQVAQVPEIERIGVFDARGAQLCGLPAERCQRLDISDRDYFQRLQTHPEDPPKVYGPYQSRTEGRPAMILARAMRLGDGRFAGVVVAVLPLDRLRRVVTLPRMGASGSVSLRTAELALLLRAPELEGPDAPDAARRVSDTLRAAVSATPAEGVYQAVTANDGVERVTAYRRLERHPLYVIAGRATSDFLAGWQRQVAWTAAFLLLFAGISWQLARATATGLRRQAEALRLYDEAPCGYHTLGPDGTYLSINATELAWLGCRRDEVVGRLKPTDFFTDEGRATFAANFPTLALVGRLEGLDLALLSRDGTARRVVVNASAVQDAQGNFVQSNSVMHDITALHEVRTQLRALAQEQGVMLDNELIGIVRVKDRRTVWKNRAMDRIFGYSGAEWDDMPSRTMYLDAETHERTGVELAAALAQGLTYRRQLQMRRKDGSAIWIDVSCARLSEMSGEVMVLLADITPLRVAEEARVRAAELEAQNFQLRETSRLKSDFVANMSHELRTPLNAILGFGQMLQRRPGTPGTPKDASHADRIVGSGRHLLALIEQVLDYANVESGKMTFEPRSVDVAQALHQAVEMLRVAGEARRIGWQREVDPGLGAVLADPLRLQQMLLALMGNAAKFSHEGGIVRVHASAVDDGFWQVAVTDQGIGIEAKDLPRLFSPFVQLSAGATKTHGGTGIGLALVKLLAQAQGGRIEVQSQPGVGSTFTLILPRAPLPPDNPPQRLHDASAL